MNYVNFYEIYLNTEKKKKTCVRLENNKQTEHYVEQGFNLSLRLNFKQPKKSRSKKGCCVEEKFKLQKTEN